MKSLKVAGIALTLLLLTGCRYSASVCETSEGEFYDFVKGSNGVEHRLKISGYRDIRVKPQDLQNGTFKVEFIDDPAKIENSTVRYIYGAIKNGTFKSCSVNGIQFLEIKSSSVGSLHILFEIKKDSVGYLFTEVGFNSEKLTSLGLPFNYRPFGLGIVGINNRANPQLLIEAAVYRDATDYVLSFP